MGSLYIQYEYWFAAFQLITAMLGMGATLTVNDFKDVVREPKSISYGLLVQLLLIPIIGFVFIHAFGLVGGVAVGVALIVAIPGGTTSNIFTYMARGNVPLSISITGLTTLGCLVTTPLILGLLITEYLPSDFTMPTQQIVTEIGVTLLLPLIVGMWILRQTPKFAELLSKWSIRASLFGILLIVIGSASAGRLDIAAYGYNNALNVLLFIVILAVFSWLASIVARLSKPDSTAIEMEVIVRNVNLGVLIKASLFPISATASNEIGDAVLLTVLLYGALQIIFAAIVIPIKRAMVRA